MKGLTSRLLLIAGVVAALAFATSMGKHVFIDRPAREALEASQRAAHVIDSLKLEVVVLESQASAFAQRAAKVDTIIRVRERVIHDSFPAENYPDTCAKPLAIRDSQIADLTLSRDSWRSAYDTSLVAMARLGEMVSAARAANDSLEAALAPRVQTFWSRLKPKMGGGGFAGVCTDGRPCAGVGITFGWEF